MTSAARSATSRRVILLVLDGFGIGAMPDAAEYRQADTAAFTLRSLMRADTSLKLPNLELLGLGNAASGSGFPPAAKPAGAFGRAALAHWGADTYAGHNELQGVLPPRPEVALFISVAAQVAAALAAEGHAVEPAIAGGSALLVDGCALVGDNLEADPGLIYNVTAPLAAMAFDRIVGIGETVRRIARTSRVIALGGTGIDARDILRHVRTNAAGQTGVLTPPLNIYNDDYRVRHLGYGIRPESEAPWLTIAAGQPVTLIGKLADVVECSGAEKVAAVQTPAVIDAVIAAMARQTCGYIAATVQETDLAGHVENASRYADILRLADAGIGRIWSRLRHDDVLIIAADHGNDPLIGHAFHTREEVPLLVCGSRVRPVGLGRRTTLADVGATVCDYLGAAAPDAGESFAADILGDGR